jgi:hypothetical protein
LLKESEGIFFKVTAGVLPDPPEREPDLTVPHQVKKLSIMLLHGGT